MQYDDFVSSVQARSGRPREETERLAHATFARAGRAAHRARRVARMARAPQAEAREGMVAVLATTRDAVEPDECNDVPAQLGGKFARPVPGSR